MVHEECTDKTASESTKNAHAPLKVHELAQLRQDDKALVAPLANRGADFLRRGNEAGVWVCENGESIKNVWNQRYVRVWYNATAPAHAPVLAATAAASHVTASHSSSAICIAALWRMAVRGE